MPSNIGEVEEGLPLHFECKVEPINDKTLKIYWLCNGNALPHGIYLIFKKYKIKILAHRFRTFHDFGFVSLDILHVYSEDSGIYTCIAENKLGKAESSVQFNCLRMIFYFIFFR